MSRMIKNFIFNKISPEQILQEAEAHAVKKLENFIKDNVNIKSDAFGPDDYDQWHLLIENGPFTEYLIEMNMGYPSRQFPKEHTLYYQEVMPDKYFNKWIYEYMNEYADAFDDILRSYGVIHR